MHCMHGSNDFQYWWKFLSNRQNLFQWQLYTYSPYPEYKTPPHPSQYYAKIDKAFNKDQNRIHVVINTQ